MLWFFGVGVSGYGPQPLPQKTSACVQASKLVHTSESKTSEHVCNYGKNKDGNKVNFSEFMATPM